MICSPFVDSPVTLSGKQLPIWVRNLFDSSGKMATDGSGCVEEPSQAVTGLLSSGAPKSETKWGGQNLILHQSTSGFSAICAPLFSWETATFDTPAFAKRRGVANWIPNPLILIFSLKWQQVWSVIFAFPAALCGCVKLEHGVGCCCSRFTEVISKRLCTTWTNELRDAEISGQIQPYRDRVCL